jgi:hypothetical protein
MLRGSLFTEDFLTEGITEYPEWKAITDDQIEFFKRATFPIVKRQDEAENGRYLTRDLILAYMRALKAGDTDVMVKV